MVVIPVGIFGYRIKYALQMAKCINTESETLVTGAMNYLRTWMCYRIPEKSRWVASEVEEE